LATQAGSQGIVVQEKLKLASEISLVVTSEQQAGRSDSIGKTATIGSQHHAPAGQTFQNNHAEWFLPAGGNHHHLVTIKFSKQRFTL
jgi:hypothetical protein